MDQDLDGALRLAHLISQAVDASPAGITIVDVVADGHPLVYVNEGFRALTGYGRDEVIGRNCRFLQCEETEPDAVIAVRTALKRVRATTVVLRNARKDGSRFWNELTLSPLTDPSTGAIRHFAGIQVDASARIEYQLQLERLATTDPLTGLANRRAFLERSEIELARARRYGTPVALVAIDIDRFKSINDRLGHGVGDDVLRHFASALKGQARQTDIVGRIGGEEFCVILPHADKDTAMGFVDRVRARLSDVNKGLPHYTFSAGIALPLPADSTIADVIARADCALYNAKRAGRDCVRRGVTA